MDLREHIEYSRTEQRNRCKRPNEQRLPYLHQQGECLKTHSGKLDSVSVLHDSYVIFNSNLLLFVPFMTTWE